MLNVRQDRHVAMTEEMVTAVTETGLTTEETATAAMTEGTTAGMETEEMTLKGHTAMMNKFKTV